MEAIKARVNPRLLSKADRLFTGTLAGRIIEVVQNARRAGATKVHITNQDGRITVCDNGQGIDDFSKLLDLGNSDWDQGTEEAEDPAGVGVFCLAPREVQIRSGHKSVVITKEAWTGEPVPVQATEEPIQGTMLQFSDEPWTLEDVEKQSVFSGLQVFVDDKPCSQKCFVSAGAIEYPKLGYRIEVRERNILSQWHNRWQRNRYSDDVLVNFHGQVVEFLFAPNSERLRYLVDLTGEPTDIRLMLPARTQLVENKAVETLKDLIEKEAYKYLQKRGSHRLKYVEYCRARELGIELPEASPSFKVGLLHGDGVEPIEVNKPDDFPLSQCYLMNEECGGEGEVNKANVHLLAALGKFHNPFIPVAISSDYIGYSWAKLPTIDQVEVRAGKELRRQYLWRGSITAVESLEITARTSDGKTFKSDTAMAIREPTAEKGELCYEDTEVLVTLKARDSLDPSNICYHLGGYFEDGDTYETQLNQFEENLDLFWSTLMGPGEYLRMRLLDCLRDFTLDWQSITIDSDHTITMTHKDGHKDVFSDQSEQVPPV